MAGLNVLDQSERDLGSCFVATPLLGAHGGGSGRKCKEGIILQQEHHLADARVQMKKVSLKAYLTPSLAGGQGAESWGQCRVQPLGRCKCNSLPACVTEGSSAGCLTWKTAV
eukprot:33347-Amphidinium_carterae.2